MPRTAEGAAIGCSVVSGWMYSVRPVGSSCILAPPSAPGPDRAARGPPISKALLASLAACATLRVFRVAPPPVHLPFSARPRYGVRCYAARRVLRENLPKLTIEVVPTPLLAVASSRLGSSLCETATRGLPPD